MRKRMILATPKSVAPSFRRVLPDQEVAGRYRLAWRHPGEFYTRLIVDDLESVSASRGPTVLDIGCGGGLLGVQLWQQVIALRSGTYIGVEPDPDAEVAPVFAQVVRKTLEQAPLEPASVDLAYSAMVIEHLDRPETFFGKLAEVLRPGGVFWAFTVDRRHYFSWFSQMLGALHLKDRYLDRVRGRRGESLMRYENFPTHYRCNTPSALRRLGGAELSVQTWSLHRVGQIDGYVPYRLRKVSRMADRFIIRAGLPGSVLAARMVRS